MKLFSSKYQTGGIDRPISKEFNLSHNPTGWPSISLRECKQPKIIIKEILNLPTTTKNWYLPTMLFPAGKLLWYNLPCQPTLIRDAQTSSRTNQTTIIMNQIVPKSVLLRVLENPLSIVNFCLDTERSICNIFPIIVKINIIQNTLYYVLKEGRIKMVYFIPRKKDRIDIQGLCS